MLSDARAFDHVRMDEQLLYSIEQAQQQLGGLSRSQLYEEIKAGRLSAVKLGGRRFVTRSALVKYVSALPAGGDRL